MDANRETYRRRNLEETILHKTVVENVYTFFDMANDGNMPLPNFVKNEFEKFISCGVLAEGFARFQCDSCQKGKIVALSCKGRGFCPSCAGRRMAERSMHLIDNVIPWVPTRQWVLSLPFQLRYWMAADNILLKKIDKILVDEINNYLRKKARGLGIIGGETGVVSFLQRAGGSVNLNLHFHNIAIDGVYTSDEEGSPICHWLPGISDDEISTVIRGISSRVIKYLRKIGKLKEDSEDSFLLPSDDSDELVLSNIRSASIKNIIALGFRRGQYVRRIGSTFGYEDETPLISGYACASLNGFSLHAATSVKAHERDKLEKLLRYVGRGPISNEKITLDEDGNILYKLKYSSDGATHILLSPLEMLEKLASIIPPPRRHQVTYYGCLSSNHNLRSLIIPDDRGIETSVGPGREGEGGGKTESDQIIDLEDMREEPSAEKKSNYISWSELLKRTFKIDIEQCDCGGRLRFVSLVMGNGVKKILDHLGLGSDPPMPVPSRYQDLFPSN